MNDTWQTAPDDLEISPHHVDIWLISTELGGGAGSGIQAMSDTGGTGARAKVQAGFQVQGVYRDPRAAQAVVVQGIRIGHGRN